MPLDFYKANAKSTGAACQFSFNSKERALFVSIKRQVSYDAEKRVGSFWNGPRALVKFSVTEIGHMLCVMEKNVEWSNYHGFGNKKTQIFFKPFFRQDDAGNNVQKGYSLAFSQTNEQGEKATFLIAFDFGEARIIRQFLAFALEHIYSAIYSADKKAAEEKLAKSEPAQAPAPAPVKPKNTSKARKNSVASEYLGDSSEGEEDPFAMAGNVVKSVETWENEKPQPSQEDEDLF